MKVLCIGSMNLDFVYSVDHIVQPGETEASFSLDVFLGGKGMNQSVALAKAGADTYHAGLIGDDGKVFLDACKEHNVNGKHIKTIDEKQVMQLSREIKTHRTAFFFSAVQTRC